MNYSTLISVGTEVTKSYCGASEVQAGSRNGPCWSSVQPWCPPSSTVLSGPDIVPDKISVTDWQIQILLQNQYQYSFLHVYYLWYSKVTDVLKVWTDNCQFTLHSLILSPHPLHFLSQKHYCLLIYVYKTPFTSSVCLIWCRLLHTSETSHILARIVTSSSCSKAFWASASSWALGSGFFHFSSCSLDTSKAHWTPSCTREIYWYICIPQGVIFQISFESIQLKKFWCNSSFQALGWISTRNQSWLWVITNLIHLQLGQFHRKRLQQFVASTQPGQNSLKWQNQNELKERTSVRWCPPATTTEATLTSASLSRGLIDSAISLGSSLGLWTEGRSYVLAFSQHF